MAGTSEEYMAGPGFEEAANLITQQIEAGVTDGNLILESLDAGGHRLYTDEEMGEEPTAGDPRAEDPMAGMEEGDVEGGEEMPMHEGMPPMMGGEDPMQEGPSMVGGSAGRDDLMDAVRFGMEEDMKKKSKHKEELGGY